MLLRDALRVLEALSPTSLAEPWDNVGLLVGDPAAEVRSILLAIDATLPVVDEAARDGHDLLYAYHPVIFEGLKRFTAGTPAFEAARRGVAVWSPHTALDVAEGGTNDVLADALGMTERRPLRLSATQDVEHKLVTFVPEDAVERVSAALFAAGAGRIGNYAACSFRASGHGTFYGEEGSQPVVGVAGRLEVAPEVRLETVVPIGRVPEVVAALRASHPYEEPAFDLARLAPKPGGPGIGRVGAVAGARRALIARLRAAVGAEAVLVAGPTEGPAERAAVCAGAGGELLRDAVAAGVDLFVTGELRHHDALRAVERGMTVVALRHSVSERCTLAHVRARLERALPGVRIAESVVDRDPFVFA